MVTNIALPRFAKIGAGAVDDLGTVVAQLGIRRPVLVTDRYLTDTGQVERLVKTLHAAGSRPRSSRDRADPAITSLSGGLDLVKAHRADGIIGVQRCGPMDTAKRRSRCCPPTEAASRPTKRRTPTPVRHLPVVAVPTTAGSGSGSNAIHSDHR